MKYDDVKWFVPIFSFFIYLGCLYVMYLVYNGTKAEMDDLFIGLIVFGILGTAFVIIGYLFIPVTEYFFEKGLVALNVFIAIASLLPSIVCSCFLSNGSDWGKTFLVCFLILFGYNIPYFLMLILIFKDRSKEMSEI